MPMFLYRFCGENCIFVVVPFCFFVFSFILQFYELRHGEAVVFFVVVVVDRATTPFFIFLISVCCLVLNRIHVLVHSCDFVANHFETILGQQIHFFFSSYYFEQEEKKTRGW